MKYGIKIKGKLDNSGFYADSNLRSVISEHTGPDSVKALTFNTAKEAEDYAKNKNLLDYHIETIL